MRKTRKVFLDCGVDKWKAIFVAFVILETKLSKTSFKCWE